MVNLSTADGVYLGGHAASKVYLGDSLVWSAGSPIPDIGFRVASATHSGVSTAMNVNAPAGIQNGDYIIIGVFIWNATTVVATAPEGFVQISDYQQSPVGNVRCVLFAKYADNEPSTWAFTLDGSVRSVAGVAAYTNVGALVPATVYGGFGVENPVTSPVVTTTDTRHRVVYFLGERDNMDHTWATTAEKRLDSTAPAGVAFTTVVFADEPATGSTQSATFTHSDPMTQGGVIIALVLAPKEA